MYHASANQKEKQKVQSYLDRQSFEIKKTKKQLKVFGNKCLADDALTNHYNYKTYFQHNMVSIMFSTCVNVLQGSCKSLLSIIEL